MFTVSEIIKDENWNVAKKLFIGYAKTIREAMDLATAYGVMFGHGEQMQFSIEEKKGGKRA